MKSTLWVALLLGLAAAATAANPTPAISNGENAPKGRQVQGCARPGGHQDTCIKAYPNMPLHPAPPIRRFRYMASLWATDKTGPKDGPFCDGTLISPWVVLTAAHVSCHKVASSCARRQACTCGGCPASLLFCVDHLTAISVPAHTWVQCVRDTDTGNNSRSEEFKPLVSPTVNFCCPRPHASHWCFHALLLPAAPSATATSGS